jgi:hypothetical protein
MQAYPSSTLWFIYLDHTIWEGTTYELEIQIHLLE